MGWVILYTMVKIGITFTLPFNHEKRCDTVAHSDKFIFHVWLFYDTKYEKWTLSISELMPNYFTASFWNRETNDPGIIELLWLTTIHLLFWWMDVWYTITKRKQKFQKAIPSMKNGFPEWIKNLIYHCNVYMKIIWRFEGKSRGDS